MTNFKTNILLVAFSILSIFITSCSSDDTEPPIQSDGDIQFTTSPIDLQGIDAKFAENIAYDDKERTQFDIFLPESETPTALIVYTHGGGFTTGDKDFAYAPQKDGAWNFPTDIRNFLSNNIAFASIRYSFLEENETEGVLKPLNDVRRALQYIRSRAEDFNIDKNNIVLTGNSAGAGTSLWIGLNDDMKDETSTDPILRESTRVKGIAVRNTQATYELAKWETDVFVDYQFFILDDIVAQVPGFDQLLFQVYGIDNYDSFDSPEIIEYRESVDMLALMDANDPDLWIENVLFENVPPTDKDIMNHHPFHARELKEQADAVGLTNITYYGDPIIFEDPSGETWAEFCIRKVNE